MFTAKKIALTGLVFLAVSSGLTKILLMLQEIDFFAPYGFTNPILIVFGAIQLLSGVLMILARTRFWAALIVSLTFLISAVVLFLAGKLPMVLVTLVATALLLWIMVDTRRSHCS